MKSETLDGLLAIAGLVMRAVSICLLVSIVMQWLTVRLVTSTELALMSILVVNDACDWILNRFKEADAAKALSKTTQAP